MYMYTSYCSELQCILPTKADNANSAEKTESSDKLYVRHNGKWFQSTTQYLYYGGPCYLWIWIIECRHFYQDQESGSNLIIILYMPVQYTMYKASISGAQYHCSFVIQLILKVSLQIYRDINISYFIDVELLNQVHVCVFILNSKTCGIIFVNR